MLDLEEFTELECPCGSEKDFEDCCMPYLTGKEDAPTAEALMRSRYCAFVVQNVDYIFETHDSKTRGDLDREEIEAWSEGSDWEALNIVATQDGLENDTTGKVEFVAEYTVGRKFQRHHELSEFAKKDGRWYFKDGALVNTTVKREAPKVGRNDPCICGSGKKYKKCCGK